MEKIKQLGMREASATMLRGRGCAKAMIGLADEYGFDNMSVGHQHAFWFGLLAWLCGNMAAMIGAKAGAEILDQCRAGMFSAEAHFQKKEAH